MNYFKFTLIKNEDGIINYELRDKNDKLIRNEKNVVPFNIIIEVMCTILEFLKCCLLSNTLPDFNNKDTYHAS